MTPLPTQKLLHFELPAKNLPRFNSLDAHFIHHANHALCASVLSIGPAQTRSIFLQQKKTRQPLVLMILSFTKNSQNHSTTAPLLPKEFQQISCSKHLTSGRVV